jgi:peptide deformylase
MAVLKIANYTLDEEKDVLRKRARPILKITEKHRRLIDDMLETMRAAAGVGLAAPQVFISERLFVYDIGEGGSGALINPEIVHTEGEEIGTEGCLSIPRLQGDVPRFKRIIVTGLDRNGKRVRIDAEEYLARVFQHEIDHLDGVMFTDRALQDSLHWITEDEESERKDGARKRRLRAEPPRE